MSGSPHRSLTKFTELAFVAVRHKNSTKERAGRCSLDTTPLHWALKRYRRRFLSARSSRPLSSSICSGRSSCSWASNMSGSIPATPSLRPLISTIIPSRTVCLPYSDGLWGFGLLYYAVQRSGRNALILGALVLSHWVLDFISHRPDLPLIPGMETRVGLGLWNSLSRAWWWKRHCSLLGPSCTCAPQRP